MIEDRSFYNRSHLMENKSRLLGAILIVAGTSIGGGMLALPVLTAQAGFLPSFVLYFLSWFFMASTGVLLMEVFLWSKKESHIVSMAEMTLGQKGMVAAFFLYLYLFYSLMTAYVAGGGNLISDLVEAFIHYPLPRGLGSLFFILLFSPFVIIGTFAVDKINRWFMAGLFITFFIFVFLGFLSIDPNKLYRFDLASTFYTIPVIFTSFGFQGIVPTLTTYLGRDGRKVRLAIWIGTLIPLFIYLLWEALILGVVPLPALQEALCCGETAVSPFKRLVEHPWIYAIGQAFAFFAIVTSFFGVALGLIDFLSDGFKIAKDKKGKALLAFLVFIPPLFFVLINPCVFLIALNIGGGLGCALLLGLLPILMAWSARYRHPFSPSNKFFPGEKGTLLSLIIYLALVLGVALIALFVPT